MTAKMALKLTASALALAAFGFVGPAMALPPTGQVNGYTYGVGVNIDVAPIVSVWAGEHANVTLDLEWRSQQRGMQRRVVINNID